MSKIRLVVSGILVIGGLIASLPLFILWDTIKIQMALGNYQLFNQWSVPAIFGMLALVCGWLLLKKS